MLLGIFNRGFCNGNFYVLVLFLRIGDNIELREFFNYLFKIFLLNFYYVINIMVSGSDINLKKV